MKTPGTPPKLPSPFRHGHKPPAPPPIGNLIELESGGGAIELENGSGAILLET